MLKLPRRGWLNSLFARRTVPIRRRPSRARLGIERCEDRTLPSSSIPLNSFGQTPQWVPIGGAPELQGFMPGRLNASGRIAGIAADPTNPDRIFITAASGGIWRTLNGTNPLGPTWVQLTDHLPQSSFPGIPPAVADTLRTLNMGAIAVAPSNPNIIYAAEGEGDTGTRGHGVLKSTDGGNTWTLMGYPFLDNISVHSLVVSRQDPNLVYFSSQSGANPGIFRTLDGGQTWTNITINDPLLGIVVAFTDVDLDPNNPDVVYACAGQASGSVTNGIYRTTNARAAAPTWSLLLGGSTVVPVTLPGNIQLTVSPTSPSTLYTSLAEKNNGTTSNLLGVYKTNDSGINWQRILVGIPDFLGGQGAFNNVIAVSPTNPQVLFVAGAGVGNLQGTQHVFMSADGGATFLDIGTAGTPPAGPHTDSHVGVFDAQGRLLLGTDGGIFRLSPPSQTLTPTTAVGSLTWVSLNGNNLSSPTITALNTLQFRGVALHPRDPNIAMGGTQDNGTARFNDNVGWQGVEDGDGGRVVYDFDNPQHLVIDGPVASHGTANFVEFSDDGGLTFTGSGGSVINPGSALAIPPLTIDPSRSARYFLGTNVLNISEDGGRTWGSNYRFFASTPGSTVTIPATPITAAISAIGTARTGNAANLPVLLVAHTNALPVTANNVTYPPLAMLRLVVQPPGTTLQTSDWTDVTPPGAGRIFQIIVDPTDVTSRTIYVVAAGGVFRTTDGAASWQDINGSGATALPNGVTSGQLDVRIPADPTDDVLFVGGSFGVMQVTNPLGNTFDWTKTANGLPDLGVTELAFNATTGILAASTFGRGVFELQIRGLIRGQLFLDTNGNGVKDAGEPIVPNATVKLLNADTNAELANTQTDANGFYEFRSILPGVTTATNFRVIQSVPGFVQTTPILNFPNFTTGSTFDVGDATLNPVRVNIGLFQLGTISGIKIEDFNANGLLDPGENAVPGFTIYVDRNNNNKLDTGELSAVTVANGTYTINGVGPDVLNGQNLGPNVIREIAPAGQTWQQIFPAAGFWSVSLTSGQTQPGINFGNIRPSSIAGGTFEDKNGNGVRDAGDPPSGGHTIELINPANGSVIQTTTSAPDGSYIFRSLVAGNYRIREVPLAGWIQTTPDPPDMTLGSNQQITNIPFGNFRLITVAGVKFDDRNGTGVQDTGEVGASGFTFEVINAATKVVAGTGTSDGTGAFQVTGLGPLPAGGQYQLREAPQAGWVQTTATPAPFTPISSQDPTGLL
ncbi:MAG TPA: SdrD B-like domain-containing protein, partial [Gemmataceae bacterium]|nr:SdrD B-like domain-containing protein [Gemmataceae bacterium]